MFLFTSRDSNVENRLAITKTIMVRVAEINKFTKIAPDFGLPSRRAKRSILSISNFWRNADGGPKDKSAGAD
jgi:hypothetical protein